MTHRRMFVQMIREVTYSRVRDGNLESRRILSVLKYITDPLLSFEQCSVQAKLQSLQDLGMNDDKDCLIVCACTSYREHRNVG